MDVLYMILGWLCSCAHGTSLPLLLLVFGDMTDVFINSARTSNFLNLINYTLIAPTTLEDLAKDQELAK